jgi:2,5-diketo-D-gluconate reductase A
MAEALEPAVKLAAIALANGRSPAQVLQRWLIQLGVHPGAKASTAQHLAENLGAVDFELGSGEMIQIGNLDRNTSCFGIDPRTFVAPEGL